MEIAVDGCKGMRGNYLALTAEERDEVLNDRGTFLAFHERERERDKKLKNFSIRTHTHTKLLK
jgi:ABC-type tungstate transport system permease subunit